MNPPFANISVAILGGGQSRRMGQDKRHLSFADSTLADRMMTVVAPLFDDRMWVAADPPPDYSQQSPLFRQVADQADLPACAMRGVVTALSAARQDWLLVVAADMPFPSSGLMTGLCRAALTAAEGTRLIVPTVEGMAHPLHAVYHRGLVAELLERLAQQQFRLQPFCETFGKPMDETVLRQWNPDLSGLMNINTPSAYQQALQQLERSDGP